MFDLSLIQLKAQFQSFPQSELSHQISYGNHNKFSKQLE